MVQCLPPQNGSDASYTTGKSADLQIENWYYHTMQWKKDDDGECHIHGWVRFKNIGEVLLKNLVVYLDIDDDADAYDVWFVSPSDEGPDKKVIHGPKSLPPDHESAWYSYFLKLHHNHGYPQEAQHFTGAINLAPNYDVEFTSQTAFKSKFSGIIE